MYTPTHLPAELMCADEDNMGNICTHGPRQHATGSPHRGTGIPPLQQNQHDDAHTSEYGKRGQRHKSTDNHEQGLTRTHIHATSENNSTRTTNTSANDAEKGTYRAVSDVKVDNGIDDNVVMALYERFLQS